MKCRAINERNDDQAIGAGLDQVAFIDKIADSGLSDNDVAPFDGDQTRHCFQFADGKRAHRLPSGADANAITILCSSIAAGHTTSPVPGAAPPPFS